MRELLSFPKKFAREAGSSYGKTETQREQAARHGYTRIHGGLPTDNRINQ
jgi:hypothetical protein